mgnify:CR=1 FL=1
MDSVVISGGGAESPSGFRIGQTRAIQTADYIGATYGAQFARRQYRLEIAFQVTRLHSSLREAEVFVLDHPASIPASGTLEFITNVSVGLSSGRWIPNAVTVRVELLQHIGLTTVWSYSFLGAEVLTANPRLAGANVKTTV